MHKIKPIAIYLPQYHPIPENDQAWGAGFTEWNNVKQAQPLFEGHYQPHIPHQNVGYYDLSDPEVLVRQAAMAKEYGIYGFAYYHYWFNGKRLLNTPLDNMLKLGKPDFPFCYIWANENWTKRWDGLDNEIIIKQGYSFEDDRNHIKFLCEHVFSDKRYITIDDKPVFIVYRTELFPDIKKTATIWREEVKKHGFPDIYLIRVERLSTNLNPQQINFDAALEFAPSCYKVDDRIHLKLEKNSTVLDYNETVLNTILEPSKAYKLFKNVFPSWDNTPRGKFHATLFYGISPEVFEYFLRQAIKYTREKFSIQEQFFFVNAWNEWGEGCHLEPDRKYGFAFLECCKRAVNEFELNGYSENFFFLNYFKKVEEKAAKQRLKMECLKKQIIELQNSKTYKLGNFLISPFRSIHKFLIYGLNCPHEP